MKPIKKTTALITLTILTIVSAILQSTTPAYGIAYCNSEPEEQEPAPYSKLDTGWPTLDAIYAAPRTSPFDIYVDNFFNPLTFKPLMPSDFFSEPQPLWAMSPVQLITLLEQVTQDPNFDPDQPSLLVEAIIGTLLEQQTRSQVELERQVALAQLDNWRETQRIRADLPNVEDIPWWTSAMFLMDDITSWGDSRGGMLVNAIDLRAIPTEASDPAWVHNTAETAKWVSIGASAVVTVYGGVQVFIVLRGAGYGIVGSTVLAAGDAAVGGAGSGTVGAFNRLNTIVSRVCEGPCGPLAARMLTGQRFTQIMQGLEREYRALYAAGRITEAELKAYTSGQLGTRADALIRFLHREGIIDPALAQQINGLENIQDIALKAINNPNNDYLIFLPSVRSANGELIAPAHVQAINKLGGLSSEVAEMRLPASAFRHRMCNMMQKRSYLENMFAPYQNAPEARPIMLQLNNPR